MEDYAQLVKANFVFFACSVVCERNCVFGEFFFLLTKGELGATNSSIPLLDVTMQELSSHYEMFSSIIADIGS